MCILKEGFYSFTAAPGLSLHSEAVICSSSNFPSEAFPHETRDLENISLGWEELVRMASPEASGCRLQTCFSSPTAANPTGVTTFYRDTFPAFRPHYWNPAPPPSGRAHPRNQNSPGASCWTWYQPEGEHVSQKEFTQFWQFIRPYCRGLEQRR